MANQSFEIDIRVVDSLREFTQAMADYSQAQQKATQRQAKLNDWAKKLKQKWCAANDPLNLMERFWEPLNPRYAIAHSVAHSISMLAHAFGWSSERLFDLRDWLRS